MPSIRVHFGGQHLAGKKKERPSLSRSFCNITEIEMRMLKLSSQESQPQQGGSQQEDGGGFRHSRKEREVRDFTIVGADVGDVPGFPESEDCPIVYPVDGIKIARFDDEESGIRTARIGPSSGIGGAAPVACCGKTVV